MIKSILLFLFVFSIFFVGIGYLRQMTGKEIWSLTKLLTYSAGCATLTLIVLGLIVILF
jgi:hypothetical protein